jgi:hypothetical protein
MNESDEKPAEQEPEHSGFFRVLEKLVPILVFVALLVHPTQITLAQWARTIAAGRTGVVHQSGGYCP